MLAIKTEKLDMLLLLVICFNYNKPGYKSFNYTKPCHHDLKEIKEESNSKGESGNNNT